MDYYENNKSTIFLLKLKRRYTAMLMVKIIGTVILLGLYTIVAILIVDFVELIRKEIRKEEA
jgi:multidrug efflux pump subunit AcrB